MKNMNNNKTYHSKSKIISIPFDISGNDGNSEQ